MTASNRHIGIVAVAAVLVGCGGALTTPDAPVADAGRPFAWDGGWGSIRDTGLGLGGYDGRGMNPCPNKMAEPIDGAPCQFLIPDAATCTGLGIRVHVLIDGVEVPQLPDDGWTFIDATETSVELHGAACDRATQSPTGVTISFTFYLV